MFLSEFEKMDSVMLVSIVNMKLRNEFNGQLDDFAKTYAIDEQHLVDKLAGAGFIYHQQLGRLIAK